MGIVLAIVKKKIIIAVNSTFNLINHRAGLINGLLDEGYEVVALSPTDEFASRLKELDCQHVPLEMERKGTHFIAPSPDLLDAGAKLTELGMPFEEILIFRKKLLRFLIITGLEIMMRCITMRLIPILITRISASIKTHYTGKPNEECIMVLLIMYQEVIITKPPLSDKVRRL